MKKINYILLLLVVLILMVFLNKESDYSSCPFGPCENCKLEKCINGGDGNASDTDEIESYDLLCYGSQEYVYIGDTLKIAISGVVEFCNLYVIKLLPEHDTIRTILDLEVPYQQDTISTHLNGAGWDWTVNLFMDENISPGLYVVHINKNSARKSWPFTVINENTTYPKQNFAYLLSTNTYQAYNNYRDTSLYRGGPPTIISKNRPYKDSCIRWWTYADDDYHNWGCQFNALFAADYALAKWFVQTMRMIPYRHTATLQKHIYNRQNHWLLIKINKNRL